MKNIVLTISHDCNLWELGRFDGIYAAECAFKNACDLIVYANINGDFCMHGATVVLHDIEHLKRIREFTYYAPRGKIIRRLGE